MNPDSIVPAPLRALEITPVQTPDSGTLFVLTDPQRLSQRQLAISPAAYYLLAQFDGRNTLSQIAERFQREMGQVIDIDEIAALHTALDDAALLFNDRFVEVARAAHAAYAAAETRDNRDRWPNADALRAEIGEIMQAAPPAPNVERLAGIIAPHLDYARGRPAYAEAYSALRAAGPARRYVILGTNHFGFSRSVVATGKDFVTPLGRVATDRGLIERIERRLGETICRGEFDHRIEHSVELQVHLLQVLFPNGGYEIVPVLCPDPSGPTGTTPHDGIGPDLGAFADALAAELAAEADGTVLIAGADLSHVGQMFGEESPTSPAFLEGVARSDQALLDLLAARREEQFVHEVRLTLNATRICSVGCIYTLLRALPGAPCRILRYHQAANFPAETHVTCCAAIVGS